MRRKFKESVRCRWGLSGKDDVYFFLLPLRLLYLLRSCTRLSQLYIPFFPTEHIPEAVCCRIATVIFCRSAGRVRSYIVGCLLLLFQPVLLFSQEINKNVHNNH